MNEGYRPCCSPASRVTKTSPVMPAGQVVNRPRARSFEPGDSRQNPAIAGPVCVSDMEWVFGRKPTRIMAS